MYSLTGKISGSSSSLYTQMSQDEREFVKYITLHGKSYGTKEEYEFRANLFKKTMEFIKRENQNKENKFTVGINKFADWTPSEVKRLLGYRKSSDQLEQMAHV